MGSNFKEFCETNGLDFLLELWDYDKNECSPEYVTSHSNDRIYFKCPRNLHESESVILGTVSSAYVKNGKYKLCKACNSVGQYIIDTFGKDYLDKIWSDKNEISYFKLSCSTAKKFYIRCLENDTHPDYEVNGNNFKISHKCPYCQGKKVCETNNFAYIYPDKVYLWSDKNELNPNEVTPGSGTVIWWKCNNNIHDDYERSLDQSKRLNYECPICNYQNRNLPTGENHPNWRGGVKTENSKIRSSRAYERWRNEIIESNNYTCQCCGLYNKELNVHHLHDFANHPDERMSIDNGIVLCEDCHSLKRTGSLHSMLGAENIGEKELEEYINYKRKLLGIHIPFSIDEFKDGNIITKDDIKDLDRYYFPYKESKEKHNKNFISIKPRFRIKEECNYG